MADTINIAKIIAGIEEEVVEEYHSAFSQIDSFGNAVTKVSIAKYLKGHRDHFVEVVQQVSKWSPGSLIGEVGVAFGVALIYLQRICEFEVTGFELSSNIPIYCKGLLAKGIEVKEWDLYKEDIPEREKFDLIICSEVVEHIFVDLPWITENIRLSLRIGGRVLLTTPNISWAVHIVELLKGNNVCQRFSISPQYIEGVVSDTREHPRLYSFSEIKRAFLSPHWKICEIRAWPSYDLRRIQNQKLREVLEQLPYPLGKAFFVIAEREI